MNKHSHITSTVFRLAVLALAMAGTGSAIAATTTASATSTIIAPIVITKAADLAFGSFAAGATAGTVTLTPGNTRSLSGVTAVTGSTSTVAKFDVAGTAGLGYSISVTGTDLSDGGTNTMAFTPVSDLIGGSITSGNATVGTLTGGTQSIFVGGVLSVGASQAPGNYTGTITALVNYN